MIRVVGRKSYETDIPHPCTVGDLMREMNLRPEGHLCIKNGIPVTRFDTVDPNDDVVIMEIFSGGI